MIVTVATLASGAHHGARCSATRTPLCSARASRRSIAAGNDQRLLCPHRRNDLVGNHCCARAILGIQTELNRPGLQSDHAEDAERKDQQRHQHFEQRDATLRPPVVHVACFISAAIRLIGDDLGRIAHAHPSAQRNLHAQGAVGTGARMSYDERVCRRAVGAEAGGGVATWRPIELKQISAGPSIDTAPCCANVPP